MREKREGGKGELLRCFGDTNKITNVCKSVSQVCNANTACNLFVTIGLGVVPSIMVEIQYASCAFDLAQV